MDERELDRAIDIAAGAMIDREPSRALSYTVMARVREGDVPTPRRAWLWVVSCVCAGGLVVAYLAINRPASEIPTVAMPQVARTEHVVVPAPQISPAREAPAQRGPQSRPRGAGVATRAPLVLTPVAAGTAPIEAITAEPIVVPAIDVPRLTPEAPVLIEVLRVGQLTIEPLVASND